MAKTMTNRAVLRNCSTGSSGFPKLFIRLAQCGTILVIIDFSGTMADAANIVPICGRKPSALGKCLDFGAETVGTNDKVRVGDSVFASFA